jgi:hypothetical protein
MTFSIGPVLGLRSILCKFQRDRLKKVAMGHNGLMERDSVIVAEV